MADIIDQASDEMAAVMELKLKAISSQGRELNPIGECYWCNEPFEQGSPKLFCDSECGTDWERGRK